MTAFRLLSCEESLLPQLFLPLCLEKPQYNSNPERYLTAQHYFNKRSLPFFPPLLLRNTFYHICLDNFLSNKVIYFPFQPPLIHTLILKLMKYSGGLRTARLRSRPATSSNYSGSFPLLPYPPPWPDQEKVLEESLGKRKSRRDSAPI